MTPWHDCAPSHSQPDGAVGAGSTHRATHRPRQLAPTRSARDTSCLPPIDPAPMAARPPSSCQCGCLTPPSSPSIGIWPGPFAFPIPIIPGINDRDVSLRWIRVNWLLLRRSPSKLARLPSSDGTGPRNWLIPRASSLPHKCRSDLGLSLVQVIGKVLLMFFQSPYTGIIRIPLGEYGHKSP